MPRNIVYGLVLLAFFGTVAGGLGTHFYYIENRPTVPDSEKGLVFPISAHGPPVYVSKRELTLLYGLEGAAIGLFGVSMLVQRRWN